ncbi:hypothetical protein [Streptomyces marianii]|nr:hypothetical protein [Streptomyces marianii]
MAAASALVGPEASRRAYRDARRTREEYRLTEKGPDLYPHERV